MKEALQWTGLRYSSKKDIIYVSWNQHRHPSAWWIPPLADGNAYVVWGCMEGKCTKRSQTHRKASFCEVLCTSSSWQRAQHFAGATSVDITQILPLCCRLGWAQEGAVSSGTSRSTTRGCTMPWVEHGEQGVSSSTAQPGHLAEHQALTEPMASPQGSCLCCLNWSTSETRCETEAKTNLFCFQIQPLLQLLGFQKWQNPQGWGSWGHMGDLGRQLPLQLDLMTGGRLRNISPDLA